MAEFTIERAERSQALLRLAIAGPSGSGKTWSSLVLAKGLAGALREAGVLPGPIDGKIGFICTERGSAKLYSHIVPFDVITLEPPYSPDRYIRALRALENAGCRIIIIDQISHAWAGRGGLLEQLNKSSGSTFNAFAEITPIQNAFVEDLLASSAHLIVTMRSKSEYVLEQYTDSHGNKKTKPRRIGTAPVQRAGIEYEFTTLVNLETEHNMGEVLKDRTNVLGVGNKVKFGEHHGEQFVAWLLAGAPLEADELPPAADRALAVCDAACRMMENARTNPDRGKIYHQYKGELVKFLDEMPEPEVRVLLATMQAKYRELADANNPAIASKGTPGTFITADDLDQIEQLLQTARMPLETLLEAFQCPRLARVPHDRYDDLVVWVIREAGKNGIEIIRPVRRMEEPEAERITAQSLIDERVARSGGAGLFAKDAP